MKINLRWLGGAEFLTALALVGCAASTMDPKSMAQAVIDNWATPSALAAKRLMEEYGLPDDIHSDRLVWHDNGPWKRTAVWNVTPPYLSEGNDADLMEQTVDYPTTDAQAAALGAFSGKLWPSKRGDELTARASREEVDFLELNLADDIIQGRMTPAQARQEYDKILELDASGKSSPYMAGLLFSFARWFYRGRNYVPSS